jgi:NAD(P)-dependent dehydrogenase (short-subunit alcohol dehydrogenase family)
MDLGLAGKPVVIVGGTTGMGYATAQIVARDGARVVIIGRDREKAERKAAALRDAGGDVQALAADATRPGEIERTIDEAAMILGGIYGLAVTAGPVYRMAPFLEFTDSDWNDHYQSTLMATVRSCQAAIPHMLKFGSGAIAITASYSTRGPVPILTPYIAMKSAVAALSKSLSMEFGPQNIRVNCVAPGAIATEALDEVTREAVELYGAPEEDALNRLMKERWHMDVALGRVGRPTELGELYAFLLSERAGYMTGAIINQDGGTHFF